MSDGVTKLLELVGQRKAVVLSYVTRSENPPPEGDERQLVIIRLSERLSELQRMLRTPALSATPEQLAALTAQVRAVPDSREGVDKLNLDGAWHLNDEFKLSLIELGDVEYLKARLFAEKQRTDSKRWSWMYEPSRLDELIRDLKPGATRDVVRTLIQLYDQRTGAGRRERSQRVKRVRYLRGFGYGIFAGLIGLIAVAGFVSELKVPLLLLAASAGLIGATVANARTLRDDEGSVRDSDARFVVIPALGATAGVTLYAFVAGGLLPALGTKITWGTVAALGFIGGFSEPFFLGTVGRIAGGFEGEKK